MKIIKEKHKLGCEEIIQIINKGAGLYAVIAIHSTKLGPPIGGIRIFPYKTREQAKKDVARLAQNSTYKLSIMGLRSGGGKGVIMGDPEKRTPALFAALAEGLFQGKINIGLGDDMGTTMKDINIIRRRLNMRQRRGEITDNTSLGVIEGMKICLQKKFGDPHLKNRVIVIQGAGKIGSAIAALAKKEGAKVLICDLNEQRAARVAKKLKLEKIDCAKAFSTPCDIFAPCGRGGILEPKSIGKLRCAIVAGCANLPLADEKYEKLLIKRGILYAPDFVINAGGILTSSGNDPEWIKNKIKATLKEVFEKALKEKKTPLAAAKELAEKNLLKI